MNSRAPTWTLRADLNRHPIQMAGETVWILQDPLSRQMHYFNAREYALLELLNGRRTLADLIRECGRRFAPDYLSGDALVMFLADARRRGLIVGGATQDDFTSARTSEMANRWWKQPLAIRLPGVNPDPVIGPMVRRLGWMTHPMSVIVVAALMIVAGIMVITQFGLLAEHVADAANMNHLFSATNYGWILTLAVVIGATKVVHELAHAICCTAFGAECREIGVMFLVGIPCLYCDVSDAWLLPQRWKRVAVSAAGMIAELTLAAVATCLWWFSAEGSVRDVCVTIMVVCSVSTVLFNGNPLLRYDGYFILSDTVGIPNLSSRARATLQTMFRSILWGVSLPEGPQDLTDRSSRASRRRFLAGYAVASGLYRIIVYTTIAYMIYRVADGRGFGEVLGWIAVVSFAWIAARKVRQWFQRPTSKISPGRLRPTIIAGIVLGALMVGLLVPIPCSVVAPGMIQPSMAHELYASVGGRLIQAARYGDKVDKDQEIVRLENLDMTQEQLRLESQCERLQHELAALQSRRGRDGVAAAKIPSVKESLRSAMHQRELHEKRLQKLTLQAPIRGVVFAAEHQQGESLFDDRVTDPRDGMPISPASHGRWIEPGTHLCDVGADGEFDVLLWVRQQDIPLVDVGQPVEVLLPDHSAGSVSGTVTQVGSEPVETIDRELLVAGLVDLQPGAERERKPRNTIYQVRVRLHEESVVLSSRRTAQAKIRVPSASMMVRGMRWFHDSFRF